MTLSAGAPSIRVAIIDGPVSLHQSIVGAHSKSQAAAHCLSAQSKPCAHGTFIANQLMAQRNSELPGIAPACSYSIVPLFPEHSESPNATTGDDLAKAIVHCLDLNTQVINLSSGITTADAYSNRKLEEALDAAQRKGCVVVVAAGNQARYSSTELTRHPWVIPVAACDQQGKITVFSNLSLSIGQHGILAPGVQIPGYSPSGDIETNTGTSFAVPFVTGAVALLMSLFPNRRADSIRKALLAHRRVSIVPPLLNVLSAYSQLTSDSNSNLSKRLVLTQ